MSEITDKWRERAARYDEQAEVELEEHGVTDWYVELTDAADGLREAADRYEEEGRP